ncbi:hypothetical protein A5764_25825 [Mycobacterium sp. 852002-51057_SCH5723018]|nr:hypothetical protein A5764_25825 [Mycobacterium sp. 852002-51057_SCH5723018]
MFGIPVIGLVCLVIGLVQRSRSRQRPGPYPPPYGTPPPVPPGYPYPPPPPMGYPGPYPGFPYPGYPPGLPPRRRTGQSGTALIIIGALLLTLGGVGIVGNLARVNSERPQGLPGADRSHPSTEAPTPEIGRCFGEFELGIGSLNGAPESCTDPVATYELAAKGGPTATCPDGKRDGSVYARLTNESFTLCFALNLQQGQCYLRTDANTTKTWTPTDCANARYAKFRVDKRIDGSTDETLCPPGMTARAFPIPPRVYCLAKEG